MPMLHTVNKSPFERRTLDSCLRHAVKGSAILLIEDGVYAAFNGTVVAEKVKAALADHKVFVLGPDVRARPLHRSEGRTLWSVPTGRRRSRRGIVGPSAPPDRRTRRNPGG